MYNRIHSTVFYLLELAVMINLHNKVNTCVKPFKKNGRGLTLILSLRWNQHFWLYIRLLKDRSKKKFGLAPGLRAATPSPGDQINRKPEDQKMIPRTKNAKNHKTKKMISLVLNLIFGSIVILSMLACYSISEKIYYR